MKKQVKNDSLFMSFVLALVAVAVISAPVDARPVAIRRSASTADSAMLLDTSRAKFLDADAAENKILPRGGTDFLDMTGKALEEAGSTLREPSASHTSTASAGQQPARAPDTMSSSFHLSDLLSGSPHAPLDDGASSASSAVAPLQSPAKLKRKRVPRSASARATDAQPKDTPPEWLRHIRNDKEREQLLSAETRDLVRMRLYNRERRANPEKWGAPAVLTPKQQSLRDSSLATALDREDFDSKDGKRFWLAYDRINYRERQAKNMSPEERDAFVAKLASSSSRRRSGELTEKQKALYQSEFFKAQDQAELDLKDPERSKKVWNRVRVRRKYAAQVSQKKRQAQESNRTASSPEQAASAWHKVSPRRDKAARISLKEQRDRPSNPRAEVPRSAIDVQRASTVALQATKYPAPQWVSQAQPKSLYSSKVF